MRDAAEKINGTYVAAADAARAEIVQPILDGRQPAAVEWREQAERC